jgi:hypothetical protein
MYALLALPARYMGARLTIYQGVYHFTVGLQTVYLLYRTLRSPVIIREAGNWASICTPPPRRLLDSVGFRTKATESIKPVFLLQPTKIAFVYMSYLELDHDGTEWDSSG